MPLSTFTEKRHPTHSVCKRGHEIGRLGPKPCRVYTKSTLQGPGAVNANEVQRRCPSLSLPLLSRFAKLPHRESLSVRHVEGRGGRTPDFGHPCTPHAKNRPLRPLQGRWPCGSLAKTVARGGQATRPVQGALLPDAFAEKVPWTPFLVPTRPEK